MFLLKRLHDQVFSCERHKLPKSSKVLNVVEKWVGLAGISTSFDETLTWGFHQNTRKSYKMNFIHM
jgi:hypothetical protein